MAPPLRRVASEYGRPDAPLGSYLGLIALFNALLGGFLAVTMQRRRAERGLPDRIGLGDILLMGVATHKLSRLIAKDLVLSGVRAPFARYEAEGSPSEVEEQPRGRGVRRAIGELITCPYCVGLWVASFFNYGLVLNAPATRLVGSIFTTLAIADFLQPLYAEATEPSASSDDSEESSDSQDSEQLRGSKDSQSVGPAGQEDEAVHSSGYRPRRLARVRSLRT